MNVEKNKRFLEIHGVKFTLQTERHRAAYKRLNILDINYYVGILATNKVQFIIKHGKNPVTVLLKSLVASKKINIGGAKILIMSCRPKIPPRYWPTEFNDDGAFMTTLLPVYSITDGKTLKWR